MSKVVSIHSFRGGTGKSNTTANIAGILASQGKRVGVVDTDIQSPGIHVLFGMDESKIKHSLNEYLWGKCSIEDAAHDVTNNNGLKVSVKIFLIPSSIKVGEITRVLREGYDVDLLNEGFRHVSEAMKLDVLLIDTHPGLNEETLLSLAISDALVIIMRPDQQDFQGTAVTVDIARSLDVPNLLLAVNKALVRYDFASIKSKMEALFEAPVAGVMPLSEDLADNASADLFSLQYPEHPWSMALKNVSDAVLAVK
jgi:MinD-like ATPase involved in chromosome partitioning or flagellar assembly